MYSFKSERINNRNFVLRQWFKGLLIVLLPAVIDYLSNIDLIYPSYWTIFIPLYALWTLINGFQKERINEISIDTVTRTLTIKYYDSNHGQVQKTFSFDNLKVKLSAGPKSWLTEPFMIYIFAGQKKMYDLTRSKDGFSYETLNRLMTTLEDLTRPIVK